MTRKPDHPRASGRSGGTGGLPVLRAAALAAALALTPSSAWAQADFLFLRPVDVGGGPTTVVAADLDLDGRLDLATADARNDSVSFVQGQGRGFALGNPIPVGAFPTGLAACDLDNDGRPDLAAAHFSLDFERITVLLNRSPGDGTVSFSQESFEVGSRASAIACADLDDDGDRDLAVTLFDDQAAMTFFNDGRGAFTQGAILAVERSPGSIAAGDLDGDGLADLAVSNDQSDSVSVLLNDPGAPGQFMPQQVVAVGSAPDEVVIADLDGDGALDLATANRGEPTATVLLNDGAAGSWERSEHAVAGLAGAIAAGDFDCDGAFDLAVASDTPDRVSVLLADPGAPGSFRPFQPFAVSDDTRSLAPGDFDGNGHLDIGTAHFRPDRASALLNQAQSTFSSFHRGGVQDDFQGSREAAFRSPSLDEFLDGVSDLPPLDFDEAGTDRWFGHTFNGLSRCAVAAELTIQAEALSGATDNDSVCLEVLDPGPEDRRFGWCSRFERLPESGGRWSEGDRALFTLDLSALVPDGRGTTGVLDLLRDGELDVLVQDETRVDFLRLALRSCCRCSDLAPIHRRGGVEDDFEPPDEPVFPRPELDGLVRDRTGSPSLAFDEGQIDRWFGHTFTGIPSCVAGAQLELKARAVGSGSDNDALQLQLLDPEAASFAWGSRLGGLPGAGGGWPAGREAAFQLDLGDLPPSGAGVSDVLEVLETGRLDLFTQDDTQVDFARLAVTPCCSQPQPPTDVFETSPALPGFGVQVLISSAQGLQVPGVLEPECIDETLCFSGAVPGRSEVFARVVGPKPNGKLWPTLVKFSTSQVEVWVKQLATGEVNYYLLPGARPGFDELPGLFDRGGFDPAAAGAVAAGGLATRATDEAPPRPDDEPMLSPEFPDFRFWVRLSSGQGNESPTRMEPDCIGETVCVSGALPGRSEVFLRVVGPKPNGRLWPTLVRFTTSTVEVWIEQVGTGALRYFRLEGASPGSNDLTGLFDRVGFLP